MQLPGQVPRAIRPHSTSRSGRGRSVPQQERRTEHIAAARGTHDAFDRRGGTGTQPWAALNQADPSRPQWQITCPAPCSISDRQRLRPYWFPRTASVPVRCRAPIDQRQELHTCPLRHATCASWPGTLHNGSQLMSSDVSMPRSACLAEQVGVARFEHPIPRTRCRRGTNAGRRPTPRNRRPPTANTRVLGRLLTKCRWP